MNKDKKIERLQQQLDKARKDAKDARKEASKAKREVEKLKKKETAKIQRQEEQKQLLSNLLKDMFTQDS